VFTHFILVIGAIPHEFARKSKFDASQGSCGNRGWQRFFRNRPLDSPAQNNPVQNLAVL
jgi:hypothetical protein